jgi:hypothetical protein
MSPFAKEQNVADKDGLDMLKAGGSVVLWNKGRCLDPVTPASWSMTERAAFTSDFDGDLRMRGKATLAIMPLAWKSGRPTWRSLTDEVRPRARSADNFHLT